MAQDHRVAGLEVYTVGVEVVGVMQAERDRTGEPADAGGHPPTKGRQGRLSGRRGGGGRSGAGRPSIPVPPGSGPTRDRARGFGGHRPGCFASGTWLFTLGTPKRGGRLPGKQDGRAVPGIIGDPFALEASRYDTGIGRKGVPRLHRLK